jgi:hypothetical protein
MVQVRWIRVAFVAILLASLAFLCSPAGQTAYHQPMRETAHAVSASQFLPPLVAEYHGLIANAVKPVEKSIQAIREEFASRFRKNTPLATSVGRRSFFPPRLAGSNGLTIKTIQTSL